MKAFGMAGMLGVAWFGAAMFVLQAAAGRGFDWTRHLMSELANMPGGWLFASATVGHAAGNLLVGVGLYRALRGRAAAAGSILFALAALGLAMTGIFAADAPGAAPSAAGTVHRVAASTSFAVELGALALFSAALMARPAWRGAARVSFALAALALAASALMVYALALDWREGLAERVAVGTFMAWELWAGAWLALRAEPRAARPVERFSVET